MHDAFLEDSCATSEFSDGQVAQLQPLVRRLYCLVLA